MDLLLLPPEVYLCSWHRWYSRSYLYAVQCIFWHLARFFTNIRWVFLIIRSFINCNFCFVTLPKRAEDLVHCYNFQRRVAKKAVAELEKMYGTKYKYGTGPEIICRLPSYNHNQESRYSLLVFADAFSGGSTDWAKEKLKVKYSYTIELRPTYEGIIGISLRIKASQRGESYFLTSSLTLSKIKRKSSPARQLSVAKRMVQVWMCGWTPDMASASKHGCLVGCFSFAVSSNNS